MKYSIECLLSNWKFPPTAQLISIYYQSQTMMFLFFISKWIEGIKMIFNCILPSISQIRTISLNYWQKQEWLKIQYIKPNKKHKRPQLLELFSFFISATMGTTRESQHIHLISEMQCHKRSLLMKHLNQFVPQIFNLGSELKCLIIDTTPEFL